MCTLLRVMAVTSAERAVKGAKYFVKSPVEPEYTSAGKTGQGNG